MFHKERRYANRTHPNKPNRWKEKKYWGQMNLDRKDNWVFGDKHTGAPLLNFSWFNIERHILIKGSHSPDDPGLWKYWKDRDKRKIKDLIPSKQRIAKNQNYICPKCRESLFNGEELHTRHVIPVSQGGKDT
jgi:RNA-directed DNA polymerase